VQDEATKIKLPDPEFGSKSINPEKFVINSRKLIYLRWQEILVSVLLTYKGMREYPKIDENTINLLRLTILPDNFEKLRTALNKLSHEIL